MQETYYYVLCLRNGKDGHPRAELRLTNRDIPVPEGADVQSLAVRVLAYFEKPNSVIEMSPEARAVFTGLQSCFNCQAALLRSEATSEAAREGTGPWFVAILAAANLIFEIGLGKLENTEAFRNRQLQLQPRHVLRAYDQVAMARALVRIWTGADLHGESFSDRPLGEEELLTAAEKLDAAMAAVPASSQYQRFALTQDETALFVWFSSELCPKFVCVRGDATFDGCRSGQRRVVGWGR